MNRRQAIADSLAASVTRIDDLLIPWGFTFEFDGVHGSHTGPYASGRYVRDATHIGLSCRDTIDNIYYQHSFVKVNLCSRETETFVIGHDTLMRALGRSDDCWLLETNKLPDAIVTRDGGDRVAALIHDLSDTAAVVLREAGDEFQAIMRRGRRTYSIE